MSQRCAVVLWSAAPQADPAPDFRPDLPPDLPDWASPAGPEQTLYGSPEEALTAGIEAGGDVLLLEAGVTLPPLTLQRLYHAAEQQPGVQVLSAVHPDWLTSDWPEAETDSALWWIQPRLVFPHRAINPSCSLWLAPDAGTAWPDNPARMEKVNGHLVCSHLLAGTTTPDAKDGQSPDPRDRPAATLLEQIDSRLWQITDQTEPRGLPYAGLDEKPVVLHILHSWGGGTARWAADTAAAWTSAHHLFLLSSANPGDSSQGQELRLYPGSLDGPCVQQWTLPVPIAGTVAAQPFAGPRRRAGRWHRTCSPLRGSQRFRFAKPLGESELILMCEVSTNKRMLIRLLSSLRGSKGYIYYTLTPPE